MRAAACVLALAAVSVSPGDDAWAGEQLPWSGSAAKAAAAAAERSSAGAGPAATDAPSGQPSVEEKLEPKVLPTAAKIDDPAKAPPKAVTSGGAAEAKAPPAVPAKKLFGAIKTPVPMAARAIGTYAKGCLAGGSALPIDGPAWQAMRLSRNRNWGHPKLIKMLERFATEVKAKDGWPGLLVGDLSQPRGGPMLTGHASHQLGLDADIWFTPMPGRKLSRTERENLAATSMLAPDNLSVNPKVFGEGQIKIVKRVASYSEVERVLVHPAIKKAMCEAPGSDRGWLAKVRPYWGHYYHFHVRMGCPEGSPGCKSQAPIPGDDGCTKELDYWYKLLNPPPPVRSATPTKPKAPVKPKPPLTLADLPPECSDVLNADGGLETAGTKPVNSKAAEPKAKPKPAKTDITVSADGD